MGQTAELPVHCSATSHWSAAGRQVCVGGLNASAGQSFATPSHVSATSQTPAAARHSAALFASAGHAAAAPVQCSATSHAPTDGRQTMVAGTNALAGHAALE